MWKSKTATLSTYQRISASELRAKIRMQDENGVEESEGGWRRFSPPALLGSSGGYKASIRHKLPAFFPASLVRKVRVLRDGCLP
jgi:hypothetical protein